MKTILIFLSLCLSFSQLSAQEHFIMHNGFNRAYLLYVPSIYDGLSPFPLILVFHGASGTDSSLYKCGFNERSEIMKYIVAYPRALNGLWTSADNDADFVSALIDTLKAEFNIESKRVYATGQSAGAYFSYRLAVQLPNKIAAIAPLAGASSATSQTITSPMPICAIHAVDDATVPYSSDQAGLNAWRTENQCSSTPDTIYNLYGVIGQLWRAPVTGADIEFYTYSHGGHSWLNSPVDCVDFIVDFFYTHPKRKIKVTLTSPVYTNFDAPSDIDISATVESDTTVIKVEYFANSIKIGESSVAPYLVTWKGVPQNEYLIYAKATLADGTSEISSNVKRIQVLLPNVALHKPFECSAIESNLYKAQYAFDGDFGTRWSTPFSDPQWISVDLQGIYRINSVTLFWETACGLAYTIDVSSDKQNWTTIYSTTAGSGGTEDITFPPIETRYVRMYGTKRATPYGYSLWEFQVHGEFVRDVSVSNKTGNKYLLDMTITPNPSSISNHTSGTNSGTIIHYNIPKDEQVELVIYNINGQKICKLLKADEKAGEHTVRWNGKDDSNRSVPSGVYICSLRTPEGEKSNKIIITK